MWNSLQQARNGDKLSPSALQTQIEMLIIPLRLTLFILLVMVVSSACPGTSPSGSTCPSQCSNCHDNMTCTSCCGWYYLQTNGTCQRCTDLNCQSCTLISTNVSNCNSCKLGYALAGTYPNTCAMCFTTNALKCSTVNSCLGTSSCLNCGNLFIVVGGFCRKCEDVYYQCSTCNQTVCYHCKGQWVVNQTNNKECVQCNSIPNCQNCINGPQCTQCRNGYFFQNLQCQPCRYPCATCTSTTICDSCTSVNNYYVLYNNSCLACWQYQPTENCTSCDITSSITCFSCFTGFYLNGNSCQACPSPCSTCQDSSVCYTCLNETYALSGGGCSLCGDFINNCTACQDDNTCLICQDGYHLDSIISTPMVVCTACIDTYPFCASCNQTHCLICLPGYIMNVDQLACQNLDCTSPCLTCRYNSSTQCISCVSGYYLDPMLNNTCTTCPPNCLQCTSATSCNQCEANYNNSLGICLQCPSGQYYNSYEDDCLDCPIYCLTCDLNSCSECQELFEIEDVDGVSLCQDVCGDGYVMTSQCDIVTTDGLADGCSENCTVQSGYNCSYSIDSYNYTNSTAAYLNTSQCHYIGEVKITLTESKQHMFSNTISMTYQIEPYLSGMPLDSDNQNQTYLRSIFGFNSSGNIGDYTVEVDHQAGEVTITVDYSQDLTAHNLTFVINYNLMNNPTMLYLSNSTHETTVNSLKQNGCFGELSTQSQLGNCQLIYYISSILALIGLLLALLGAFTKELAGLEQLILFQTIFCGLLFRGEKATLAVLSLQGFKYSLGVQFPLQGLSTTASTNNYLLSTRSTNLTSYYLLNFALYIFPLAAVIFLLYKLKYKTFPFKMERGRTGQDCFKGEVLLYVCLVNLFPLVVYCKLFIVSGEALYYWDCLLAAVSVLLTLAAIFNYVFRPEIVGIFRSAFRSFGGDREQNNQSASCLKTCVTRRFCQSSLANYYPKLYSNFYYIFIAYMLFSSIILVTDLGSEIKMILVVISQIIMFLLLIASKPYFNKYQKVRSAFTFSLMVLANFISLDMAGQFTLPLLLVAVCGIHVLFVCFILIASMVEQIKRRCNDRTEIVKRMFRVDDQLRAADNKEKQQIQSKVMNELISRFNMSQQLKMNPLQKINPSHAEQEPSQRGLINNKDVKQPIKEQEGKEGNKQLNLNESDRELKQQVILEQEHEYIRYQRGLAFFDRYGNKIEKQLVDEHYNEI